VPLSNTSRPLDNELLAALPRDHFELLVPYIATVTLEQGLGLSEPGDEIADVFFPHDGMLSMLAVMRDGKAIETATVGREGVVGAMAGLSLYKSLVGVVVQLPTSASKISATNFRKVVQKSDVIRDLCVHYNEVLLSQARVTAACNTLHRVEQRFCRWLLQTVDRAGGDKIGLTQEFLAEMLGVRRTSVTEIARKVQAQGLISYSRGLITILDRNCLPFNVSQGFEAFDKRREVSSFLFGASCVPQHADLGNLSRNLRVCAAWPGKSCHPDGD
jgi:CRP-like cAMP-binding protein